MLDKKPLMRRRPRRASRDSPSARRPSGKRGVVFGQTQIAGRIKAWAICGAANNVLAEPGVENLLVDRGVLYVPEVIGSAGAVIEGIGATVMKLTDRSELIDLIGATAREVLEDSLAQGRLPTTVTEERARKRIRSARKRI